VEARPDATAEVRWGPTLALVVLATAAAVAAGLHVRTQSRAADVRAAHEQLAALCMALALHHDAVGRYPSARDGLNGLWGLDPETRTDPWGAPIGYAVAPDQQSFALRATGDIALASADCTRRAPSTTPSK